MAYQIRTESRPAGGGLDGTVYVLEETTGAARAEVWPAQGFNCYLWQVRWGERPLDLLYAAANVFQETRPTRNGVPVLFPFPNRIRDGRFTWEGKEYRLPLNDSAGKNAIHGFACRHPWRVVDQGADEQGAWVTGDFWSSLDAPEERGLWPADYRLRLTYRLEAGRLRLEALVENPDSVVLPFGLGFHPYLRVPLVPGAPVEDCWVEAGAHAFWELVDSLPTGARRPVDPDHALIVGRRYSELTMDAVLTDLGTAVLPGTEGLYLRGRVRQAPQQAAVSLLTSAGFRELVVFTPPHRQAVCLEPYTCTTDAINLHAQGVDAGLIALPPASKWSGAVEWKVETAPA